MIRLIGTKQRTADAIGIYTAQRISDAVLLGRQHIRKGRLEFTQQKNRRPLPGQGCDTLDAAPGRSAG